MIIEPQNGGVLDDAFPLFKGGDMGPINIVIFKIVDSVQSSDHPL